MANQFLVVGNWDYEGDDVESSRMFEDVDSALAYLAEDGERRWPKSYDEMRIFVFHDSRPYLYAVRTKLFGDGNIHLDAAGLEIMRRL